MKKEKKTQVAEVQEKKNRITVGFRVKEETANKIITLADEDERSQGQIVDYAIEEYYAKYKK